jgi:hypothetical protein
VSTTPDPSERETGSALFTASAWVSQGSPAAPNAGPEVVTICSPGSGVPLPGGAAVSCQLWPSMVPDAIRPVAAWSGPGAWTVTV